MSKEFGSRPNVIEFTRTTQNLVSGNNALKAEVWQNPQAVTPAPVIEIDKYRRKQQEASLPSKDTQDLSMLEIDRLEDQWNKALGITQQEGFYNYHPVLARWRFEQNQKAGGEIVRFKLNENQNVTTALRERDHTRESRLKFVIEGNKIKAEFSDEPHETTILRGLAYRTTHGSKETDRESSEVRGFQYMQDVLTSEDTPVGTKVIVISGRGSIKNTQYADNFVDFYELKEDELKKRYISYTRFSSASDYDSYKKVANTLSPNYFYEYEGPIDAWFLAHPILITPSPEDVDHIFDKYFEKDPKAMEERDFLERSRAYQLYISYFLDDLTKPSFDPVSVARDWNSLLLSPDHKEMQVKDLKDVASIVSKFGWMQPAQVMAGCGLSAGFKIGTENSLFSNSVGSFGLEEDKYGSRKFDCPECGKTNIRPKDKLVPNCQHCGSSKVAC